MNPQLNFLYPVSFINKASKEQKQMALSQKAFYDNLTGKFNQQFAYQKNILDYLQSVMKPLIESPTGFVNGEEAALRTQASDSNSAIFNNALRAFQSRSFAMGEREVPSGGFLTGLSGLLSGAAASEAQGQRDITLAGANLKRQQLFSAAQVLSGAASLTNPAQYGGLAINAGDSAYKSIKDAFQPTNWLGTILGGAIQAGMSFIPGLGQAGTLGKFLSPGQISGAFGGPTSVATQPVAEAPWVIG